MTKLNTNATDGGIPPFLKRETNAKGVTLSAGAVTATGAKTGKGSKRDKKAAKAAIVETPAPVATVAPQGVVDPSTGEPIEKVKRSIVPMKFKAKYKAHGGTCGDDMALELKAATTTRNADKRECLDVEALWTIAKSNGVDVSKYVDLNNGQKRMNVGNKLRGKLAAGEDVVIGSRQFKAEDFQPRQ